MRVRIACVALALLALCGCGKPQTPKVDAATEREQALQRSREGAFGEQVKALDTAKNLGADMNKKAEDMVDKAEKDTK